MSDNEAALPNAMAERFLEPPPAWVNVWVVCGHVRCLAYRTNDGKWVGTFDGQEIDGVTGWSQI